MGIGDQWFNINNPFSLQSITKPSSKNVGRLFRMVTWQEAPGYDANADDAQGIRHMMVIFNTEERLTEWQSALPGELLPRDHTIRDDRPGDELTRKLLTQLL